ncbi:glycosyltransferase family 1 protein [Lactiplantibacillus plantarum]|uniref:glycosyltransferase family 4 protein n=1 Tax=Lactiplantibacillus plantarum TaxID=1590 RepID=UPI0021820A98|nr:glycosyltransferase family 4 protein [Lactiplantibacillus plantarum]MCT1223898.1 glycosyltransferase family 1 protein [Lactiplantibacillus plantarum]
MKKILFLHAGAEMYGADKVMLDLISRLNPEQYQPLVVLPTEGVLVTKLREANVSVEVMPYPVMRRKYFNPVGALSYFFDFIKYSNQLIKFAKKHKIDIIHTNTAAVMEGAFVSKRLGLPQLWSIHEIIVSPRFMYKFTSAVISRYSTLTVTDSKAVKVHLERSGYFSSSAPRVIYNGVDSERFSPANSASYLYDELNIPKNAKIIGMMGRVNSWKGQDDFLTAAELVMAEDETVYTVFVGSAFAGEEWREADLKDRISKSKYKDRIINQGYRTDSQAFYKLFDVFVLPSTRPDPLPTVVLEAMATGKPIVGYRHGGVCEMVSEGYNGLLADVGDTADLGNKILSIVENPELLATMGLHSRKRLVSNFSMDAYVRNYEDAYEYLIKK